MGERAKIIINEWLARELLKRDTLDLDKFYTADLKLFVEVARKEIERLNNIINNGKNKVQEVKEHLDKSGFDGMTKSILIMALNEIIYSLNGDGSNEKTTDNSI